jgi:hypothetical protein
MRFFTGKRSTHRCEVMVDGQPLDPRIDLRLYSDQGFEWGYDGAGPRQLSVAILAAHFSEPAAALEHHRRFLSNWVIAMREDVWSLDTTDIDRALNEVVEVPMTLEQLLNKVRGVE